MRVVSRLALLFVAASCLVLVGFSYFAARGEVERTRRANASELGQLGRVMAHALAAAQDLAGESAASRIIETFEPEHGDLAVAWSKVEPSGTSAAPGRVVQAFPIGAEEEGRGYLTLSLRVPTEADIMTDQLLTELLGGLLLALSGGLITVLLGASVIGRPLDRVVAQARRIGAGDFSGRLRADGTDETGALKRELNVMCDQLEAAKKRVEDETAAKTATLEQLRHLDRLRTVGTIASAVAHELGTPLNVILIHAQSMLADEPTREVGEAVTRQVERMSAIVRGMLDFARQSPPAKDRLAPSGVARSAAELVRPLARQAGVSMTVTVEEDGLVAGDAAQLEQALTNLIVNSIHATDPDGWIVLRVGRRRAVTPPDTERTVDACFIEVSDSGRGMHPSDVEKVFQPFYTTKARGAGTGLGLGVASGIAADHGGWISASSIEGTGSTFTLWLPSCP